MAIFSWNAKFDVGIPSVDQEHRRLFEIINQVDDAIALGSEPREVLVLVDELIAYTHYHFENEEELMREAGYPTAELAEHEIQHREFAVKMAEEKQKAMLDPDAVSNELLEYLVAWLSEHILLSDQKMAQDLLQKRIDDPHSLKQRQADVLQSNLFTALRESEVRFRALADHFPALIWVTNAKLLPIFCNKRWLEACGLKKAQLTQQDWLQCIDERDRERVIGTYEQAASQVATIKIEYRLACSEGNPVWILETVVPRVRDNGKFAGLMGCGMDISEQKMVESRLEQKISERTSQLRAANQTLEAEKNQQIVLNQQLQDAQSHLIQSEKLASIGQLAAGVAHEINNPLGYIYSNLNTLQQYLKDLLALAEAADVMAAHGADGDEAVRHFRQLRSMMDWEFLRQDLPELLEEAKEGAIRAKKIVQELRDFSRSSQHQRLSFDLEAGIDSTLNIVHNELRYKAEVIKEYAGLEPLECVGEQLNQVFMNFLVNAAQAIEDFGTITVRTGYQDKDWLWVDIEDTGSGMSPELQAKVFDPFFTTKPVGKGTGLGLSISYKIIQDHGGRIEVHSEVGKGSCFRIYLPRH